MSFIDLFLPSKFQVGGQRPRIFLKHRPSKKATSYQRLSLFKYSKFDVLPNSFSSKVSFQSPCTKKSMLLTKQSVAFPSFSNKIIDSIKDFTAC